MLKKTLCLKMLVAAFSLSVFLTLSCGGNKEPVESVASGSSAMSMEQLYAENGSPVSVRKLEPEDFSVYLKYPTVIYASSESTAYAGLSDVVRTISKKVGDKIARDEIIVSFSAENQQLQQAQLSYENALAAFNRSSALFRNNDISRQEFETVKMRHEAARATLRAANDMVYVKAPIAGTVTQINVHPTENVRPGAALFTVSGQNGFEARFYVGIGEIDRIMTGARVFIDSTASAPKIEGRITQVSLIMDSQKQAFPVTAFFDTDSSKLISGMGVDLAVETYRNEKAIVVSRRELMKTDAGYQVFIAVENAEYGESRRGGLAKPVAVKIGQEQGLHYEITQGLAEGDMLISDGIQRLMPDMPLNVVSATSTLMAAVK